MSYQVHSDFNSTLQHFLLSEDAISRPVSSIHLQTISLSHCTKWRFLPAALDMESPATIVNDIERKGKPESEMRVEFFSQWQTEKGEEADYKRLINALLMINCKQDAEFVCRLVQEYSKSVEGPDHDQSSELAKENLEKVKSCFASLVSKVSSKLSSMDIDMGKFRQFITNLFPPGDFITDTTTIVEIFNTLTHKGLWSHHYCSTFESVYKEFGQGDPELRGWISKYKSELAGFKATTKIIDYIKLCNDEENIADPDDSITQYKAEYDKKYCRRLAFKLKKQITEKSLEYVDDFWRSIADLFVIPSLPVLLENIREGCTEITWLIPSNAAFKLQSMLATCKNVLTLFEQYEVVQVTLDDKIAINNKNWRTEEGIVEQLQLQMKKLQEAVWSRDATTGKGIKREESPLSNFSWPKGNHFRCSNDIIAWVRENSAIRTLNTKIQKKLKENQKLRDELTRTLAAYELRETELRDELQDKEADIESLKEDLEQLKQEQSSLQHNIQFTWMQGPDMPHAMSVVQSATVDEDLYIGGGYADLDESNDYTIMRYDSNTLKWSTLPPYRTCDFSMAAINKQLVLVGGLEDSDVTEEIGVWEAGCNTWTHPYQEMPTARCCCSVAVYEEKLVVAGGEANRQILSCVEILDTYCDQWYAGPPTPIPWYYMKSAIVDGICYFMGGYVEDGWTPSVYSINFDAALNFSASRDARKDVWKELPALPADGSSPLSFNGSLFAIGGASKACKAVSDIRLYQPETEEWVKVGNLPSPRHHCTCVAITNRKMLIAGGNDENDDREVRMDIGQITEI